VNFIANLDQFNAVSIYSQVGYPWRLLLHIPPLQYALGFSTPAFSTPAIIPVPHFPLPHFQSPQSEVLQSLLSHLNTKIYGTLLENFG